jgi:multiple sugar transport system permease protein
MGTVRPGTTLSGATAPAQVAVAPRRRLRVRRSDWGKYLFCYAMLAPVVAIFAYLRIIPIVQTFEISFYKWDMTQPVKPFIGADNYVGMLTDERFLSALRNTTIFSFATVLGSVALALPVAVLLAGRVRFTPLYQAIFFLPVITPMVPMSVAWKWIYDPTHGILNYLLSLVGVAPIGWLVYPETALWAIIAMSIWKVVGYNMVILLVGIKNIPTVYFEAARIDGAAGWALFRAITLPLLRPILLVVFVTSTINAYNVFTQVYVMTLGSQAAPGNALRVLVYEIYQNGFQFFRMGYASAEAVVLTVIVFALTLFQFWVMRRQQALA